MKTDLEIVICTHNRERLLTKTLYFINQANRPTRSNVSILVIANCCTDGTEEILKNYVKTCKSGGTIPLRWFPEETPGKSHALNKALSEASGELLAFVDDDHRIDENYLVKIIDAAEKHRDIGIFCGRILPDWNGSEPEWVHDQGPYRIYPLPIPNFNLGDDSFKLSIKRAVPGGGNLICRKKVFDKVGTFAPHLGPRGDNLEGSEDTDWVYRAAGQDIGIQYVPEITQYHYVDPDRLKLGYLCRKAYKRSAAITSIQAGRNGSGIPLYLFNKLIQYLMNALVSFSRSRRRFYLVRMSATLGEMQGHHRKN